METVLGSMYLSANEIRCEVVKKVVQYPTRLQSIHALEVSLNSTMLATLPT